MKSEPMKSERMIEDIEQLAQDLRFERGYVIARSIARAVGALVSPPVGGKTVRDFHPTTASGLRIKTPATGWS